MGVTRTAWTAASRIKLRSCEVFRSYSDGVSTERVGAIDDPIWTSGPEAEPRRKLSLLATCGSALLIVAIPLVTSLVRGFDWEAILIGLPFVFFFLVLVQRRLLAPALVSAALALALFAMVEGVNVLRYHSLRLDGPPPRVSWCGREYSTPSFAARDSTLGSELLSRHSTKVLVAPSGTALYAGSACNPNVGQTLIFAPTSTGALVYSLEGGP